MKNRTRLQNSLMLLILLAVTAIALAGCTSAAAAFSAGGSHSGAKSSKPDYIYGIPMDDHAGVVTESCADVYSSPDIMSERVTQALYNQPVSILQREESWAKVETVDGSTGWMRLRYIDTNLTSIYGRTCTHRIIVTGREKSITSGPSGGITLVNAPMGTELYAFNNSDDAYEVYLPGKKTGWVKGSGIIHVELGKMIPVTNADDFAATALRLKGTSYLLNGMSARGIDAPGLVYICARINGVDLPGTIEGQLSTGTEIKPANAAAGDLVFLSGSGEGEGSKVSCVGICIGGGKYLYAGRNEGYVTTGDMKEDGTEGTVVAVRRIFN